MSRPLSWLGTNSWGGCRLPETAHKPKFGFRPVWPRVLYPAVAFGRQTFVQNDVQIRQSVLHRTARPVIGVDAEYA